LPQCNVKAKINFFLETCDPMDLPQIDKTKKLNCPGEATVKDVVIFLSEKIKL